MSMWIIIGIYLLFNLLLTFSMSLKAMYADLWENQCLITTICIAAFFAPAWAFKGIIYGFIFIFYWILTFVAKCIINPMLKLFKFLYNKIQEFKI